MADRTVYGRTHSENGWRMVDTGSCVWVKVPGTSVTLQIREGQPAAIMGAFAADYNAYVEPLRDADSACWTPTNSVASSNHLSGTGMDLNWNGPDGKTFRLGITKERAYPGDKARKLDELIAFYEGMIFCGGEWSIRDWMHFQMGGKTYGSQHVEKVNDFIRRKIRADGFSTFKRGGTVTPPAPQPTANAIDVLARATGLSPQRAGEILPAVVDGLTQSECTTVNRIAMWLAQCGHESAGFNATEEYQNGPMDQERWIYKGRTWIQLTWRSAYEGFGKWCHARGLVSDPNIFVNNPRSLADLKWAGLGAAYYWTTTRRETRKYPTLNQASDARDLLTATQIINGGTNGLADRQSRYNRALALGDQLLVLTQPSTPTDELEELLMMSTDSWSIYATPGEPDIPVVNMIKAIDAYIHRELTDDDARAGDPEAIRRVARTAGGLGKARTPGAINHAVRVLNEIQARNPEYIVAAMPGKV